MQSVGLTGRSTGSGCKATPCIFALDDALAGFDHASWSRSAPHRRLRHRRNCSSPTVLNKPIFCRFITASSRRRNTVLETLGTPTTANERLWLAEPREASGDTGPKLTARSRAALRAIFGTWAVWSRKGPVSVSLRSLHAQALASEPTCGRSPAHSKLSRHRGRDGPRRGSS